MNIVGGFKSVMKSIRKSADNLFKGTGAFGRLFTKETPPHERSIEKTKCMGDKNLNKLSEIEMEDMGNVVNPNKGSNEKSIEQTGVVEHNIGTNAQSIEDMKNSAARRLANRNRDVFKG